MASTLAKRILEARKQAAEAKGDENAEAETRKRLETLTEELDAKNLTPEERAAWVSTQLNGNTPEAFAAAHGTSTETVEKRIEAAEKKLSK